MTPSIYQFPRLEISSPAGRVRAQIIGKSALAKKLQVLLRSQEIVSEIVADPAAVNISRPADFVFWLLMHNSRKIPAALSNYLKSSQAKLIIISSSDLPDFPDTSDELLTNAIDAGIDACRIFIKDVYGPGVGDSPLSLIWQDIKAKFVINLPDDDAAEIYPIYLDDAAAAIIKISFSTQTYGRTFYISGVDKITVLSFSYRLREEIVRQTQKLPSINYTQTSFSPSSFFLLPSSFDSASTRAFLSWTPEIDLSEGLSKLIASLNPSRLERAEDGISEIIDEEPDKVSVSLLTGGRRGSERGFLKKKTTLRFRRGFVFPLVLATLFAAATLSLPRLLDQLAASLAGNSPTRLAQLEPIFSLLGRRQKFLQLQQSAAFNQSKSEIAGLAGQLLQSIFTPDSLLLTPYSLLDELDSRSAALLLTPYSFYSLLPTPHSLLQAGDWRSRLGLARELIPAVRLALAGDRKKTFLIVLQNSAEIRPTGGFISSLIFITVHKGKILDIDYQSVYQLDSQLVGVEPPPAPIADRLGETNWLIRDSNWAADASNASQKIESLIERAAGRVIDGTVFLTTSALQSILAQTGEIVSPDGTVWNQLNAAERLVYADRADPQTGQRSDPLISVAKALEEFVKTNPNRHLVIAGALSAVSQNNILITSSDPAIAQIVKNLRVDGSLPPAECPPELNSPACLADQISIVDANLGANKADYFMLKEHDIGVSLSTTAQTSSAVTLRYQNTAASSQYPAGTYRNYVRVYLPQDSIITSVVRLAPDGLVTVPTDNSIESGRKAIGWYMEIPVGGQEIFRLESVRPAKLVLEDQAAAYSLVIRKQPGTAIPVSVSVGFPPNLAPLAVSDKVTAAGNKLLLNHGGENNLSLNVEFATTE